MIDNVLNSKIPRSESISFINEIFYIFSPGSWLLEFGTWNFIKNDWNYPLLNNIVGIFMN